MTLKSTIVRLSQRAKLAAIRTLFGTLERAAPGLGAWWAERLWITMPRFRGTRRPNTLPLGETFTVQVGGRRVRGRAWGSGPVVYLVHGWGGAGIQLDAFVGPLLAGGYRVVMFDALSHGASDAGRLGPRRSAVPELAEALTAVVAEHGRAHAVIAHSLGCTAVCYALRHGLPADRLVFLAPLTRPTPYTFVFAALLGFDERIRTRMTDRAARRIGVPWAEFDIPSHVDRIDGYATIPLLLVHDPRDRETRYADSLALREVWPGAELVTVTGLGHWRLLRDEDTVARAVAFVHTTNRRPAGTTRPAAS